VLAQHKGHTNLVLVPVPTTARIPAGQGDSTTLAEPDPGVTDLYAAGVDKHSGAPTGIERDLDPVLHEEDAAGAWDAS
jgi:hypothetical protein